jgi:heterodisulfide reductase subunit C/nitrate reductase gamma subunit
MEPTRETFGNIPASSQYLFYVLAVVSTGIFVFGVWRRFRLWRQGQSIDLRSLFAGHARAILHRLKPGLRRVLIDGLGQKRVRGRGAAGYAHILLFAGFMVLLLGTTLLEIDHLAAMISENLSFHRGTYYVIYEFTLDVFGLLFLAGCAYFLWRRTRRPASVGHRTTDWWVLGLFIAIGVSGYLLEGLRMVWQQPTGLAAQCAPVGLLISKGFAWLGEPGARGAHFGVWWLHAVLVFGFFAAIPFTRLLHFVTGPLNLFFAQPRMGVLQPLTLEEIEQSGRVGVSDIRHFTQQQLLSIDACMECGRCQDVCPAYATGKPLSPKTLVQDLKRLMDDTLVRSKSSPSPRALHGDTIAAETLWACTACNACVNICPVRIDQVTLILDLRRHLVAEGGLSGTAAAALRRMQSAANPWGLPAADRAAWRGAPSS